MFFILKKQESENESSQSSNGENNGFDARMMDVLEPKEQVLYVIQMVQNALKRG